MLLYATVQGQKGILKFFAARLNKRRVPRLGGACTKDWGASQERGMLELHTRDLLFTRATQRKRLNLQDLLLLFFLMNEYLLKNLQFLLIGGRGVTLSFIGVRTTCSQVSSNKFHCLLGCPVSFVLMLGCSLDCCETHRGPLNLEFIPSFICAEHSVPQILAPKFRFK